MILTAMRSIQATTSHDVAPGWWAAGKSGAYCLPPLAAFCILCEWLKTVPAPILGRKGNKLLCK